MYLYSTSLFYFASCLFSSHPLPPQPVGTLNSCPTGSLSRTAGPGTAPQSSLPSSNTTVSPGEGKSPTQIRINFRNIVHILVSLHTWRPFVVIWCWLHIMCAQCTWFLVSMICQYTTFIDWLRFFFLVFFLA